MSVRCGRIRAEERVYQGAFVRLPLAALLDPNLTPQARQALAMLLHYEFRDHLYPGHERAARDFHWNRRSLLNALRVLEEAGWIRRTGGGPGEMVSMRITLPRRGRPPVEAESCPPEGNLRPLSCTESCPPEGNFESQPEARGCPPSGQDSAPSVRTSEKNSEDSDLVLFKEAVITLGKYSLATGDKEVFAALKDLSAEVPGRTPREAVAQHQALLDDIREGRRCPPGGIVWDAPPRPLPTLWK
jgi:hypothetical protein